MSLDSAKQALESMRSHLSALETAAKPDVLSDLMTRVRDIDSRLNDLLPRMQKLGDIGGLLRQVHDDMGKLQSALSSIQGK